MDGEVDKKQAEQAAAKLYSFIEQCNAAGAFKSLQKLDEIRGSLVTLCVCAQIDVIAGNPVFSSPSKVS